MISSREVAFDVINRVNEKGSYANILLPKVFEKVQLDSRDKALTTHLVYGTIRNKLTIDWIIEKYSKKSVKSMNKKLADLLRMGIYQIHYLDRVPDRAAVNETVELSKKFFHKKNSDFVNAILRNVARNKKKISYEKLKDDFSKYLAIKYSHPQWMTKMLIEQYNKRTAEAVCKADNKTPKITLRVNDMRISKEAFVRNMKKRGFKITTAQIIPNTFYVKKPGAINKVFGWEEGLFFIQDQSSLLVAHVVEPQTRDRVIDACAAPGGKTIHLSVLMKNKGYIIASDSNAARLALLDRTRERMGLKNIIPLAVDARRLDSYVKRTVNRALVDAPCSGLGTLARKPDERWRKNEESINGLVKLQGEILDKVARLIKKDGILVYSVCTWTKQETDEVCRSFLERNKKYELDNLKKVLPFKLKQNTEFGLQIMPHTYKSDGMFITRFKKVK